jgi:hypothetical protein
MARKTRKTVHAAAILAGGINGNATRLDATVPPASCSPPETPKACVACSAGSTASDASTALLERGITLAEAEAIADPFANMIDPDDDPSADDLAELAEWSTEQTAREHLDRSGVLSLPELVEHQAAFYRSWPTAAGEIIARHLEGLALKIRMTDATTPEEFDAREGVLDDEVRQQRETIGYEAGLAAGREECRRKRGRSPSAGFGGHPAWED